MSESWKLTLPCTRAEAEAIDAQDLAIDAVLMTTETVEDNEHWRLDAYFEGEPGGEAIAAVRALVPSAAGTSETLERLDDADWVTMSQAGLEPIREGRFVVYTSAYPVDPPHGVRAFLIEAGRAFGTGHHETTGGCLAVIDALRDDFTNVIDIGTGTGLLAFAAREVWPGARVTATDIDPQAIEVTRANALANDVPGIDLILADGALDDRITAAAPYDLVIANVLAGPLISMAPELAAIAAPDATIILAGLLDKQREAVVAAYAECGCTLEAVDHRGDWSILKLSAGPERYIPTKPIDPKGRDGWALDL